jgi:glutathione S-transferase
VGAEEALVYRVYGDGRSGNCYKVQLLMAHLGIEHEWVHVDIMRGETRTAAYLAKNPIGKIPLLELEPGRHLPESNAILNYLAHGTPYLPDDRWARANVLKWQFFEQYSHEPYIAVARFISLFLELPDARRAEYESKQEGGRKALAVMEGGLAEGDYFVGGALTIADVSLYAYTHVAHEGGFDLEPYPAVRAWLDRVAGHPRHVPMAPTAPAGA